jgi:hypothetical protein
MKLRERIKNGSKSLRAFTVIDAVMAVLVLATVGSAFCTSVSCGFIVLQTTREDVRATQILMQKMEAVRLCTWSELTNSIFIENYDPLGGTNQIGTVYYGNLSINAATNIPSNLSYSANMAMVTVNLNWTNYNRGVAIPHNRQMQTQVARYGLQNYIWGAIQ